MLKSEKNLEENLTCVSSEENLTCVSSEENPTCVSSEALEEEDTFRRNMTKFCL